MALSRKERELTDEYLGELIADDPIKRNEDLRAFIKLLDDVEGGFSFFLDGKWGSGKTVFVKQAALLLRWLHGTFHGELGGRIAENICKGFEGLQMKTSFLPIYYNAWENDGFSDSVVTLLGTLVAEAGDESYGKEPSEPLTKLLGITDALLKPFGLDAAISIRESFAATDLLASMKEIQAVRTNFRKLVSTLLYERAEKLVLFVDELDRCSPAFALQLIERIKFVMAMDNVVIVLSTDTVQLAHTVEGYYGSGFNGHQYLTRYYDLKLNLRDIVPSDFLAKQGFDRSMDYFNEIVLEIANSHIFSMRDCIRYLQEIEPAKDKALMSLADPAANLLIGGVLPVLLAIKIDDSTLYRKVLSGAGADELLDIGKRSQAFVRYLSACAGQYNKDRRDDEYRFETPDDFYRETYLEAFGIKRDNSAVDIRMRVFTWVSPESLLKDFLGIQPLGEDE
jgi:hypothetical protein